MTKRSQDVNEKGYLLCETCLLLVASAVLMSSEIHYFWGNDLSFFSFQIKNFGHFNLSILRISSNFKWEFSWIPGNVVVFSIGANETSEFSLGGGFSSSTLPKQVKYRAEISLKVSKIG